MCLFAKEEAPPFWPPTLSMFDTDQLVQFFERVLLRSFGQELEVEDYALVTGGDINTAVCIQCKEGNFFLKFRADAPAAMFEAEARGLDLLRVAGGAATPGVVGFGEADGYGYLMLEFIESQVPSRSYWDQLGTTMATLHQHQHANHGLGYDNFLGTLDQPNEVHTSWPEFWAMQRVLPLAGRALLNETMPLELFKRLEQLNKRLPDLLPADETSLLHGDFWSGNVMPNEHGKPVLYDPAVYYGHREVDIAMTRLFGGFPSAFYHAYQEVWPLLPGWADRLEVYNLYPLLVHLNLFGVAYLPGIDKVLKRFGV